MATPEVAGSSAHNDEKEAVAAPATTSIRPHEVEKRLPDDVVRVLRAGLVKPRNHAPRISNDGFRRHTAGRLGEAGAGVG
jgi:hypothetical protein